MNRKARPERGRRSERHGRLGETLAALLLRCKGYRILDRRMRTHAGEIDIIAKSPSGIVCFVEVKARRRDEIAIEAVDARQRARIVRAAELYLAGREVSMRFDVISVIPGRLPRHMPDAWRPDSL